MLILQATTRLMKGKKMNNPVNLTDSDLEQELRTYYDEQFHETIDASEIWKRMQSQLTAEVIDPQSVPQVPPSSFTAGDRVVEMERERPPAYALQTPPISSAASVGPTNLWEWITPTPTTHLSEREAKVH